MEKGAKRSSYPGFKPSSDSSPKKSKAKASKKNNDVESSKKKDPAKEDVFLEEDPDCVLEKQGYLFDPAKSLSPFKKNKISYDISALTWDQLHIYNLENKYCYCGNSKSVSTIMLQCSDCKQWFHNECLKLQLDILPVYGDFSYHFTCCICSGKGIEVYTHKNDLKWDEVVRLCIFNLTVEKFALVNADFFEVYEIHEFFERNRMSFVPYVEIPEKTEQDAIEYVLRLHPNLYELKKHAYKLLDFKMYYCYFDVSDPKKRALDKSIKRVVGDKINNYNNRDGKLEVSPVKQPALKRALELDNSNNNNNNADNKRKKILKKQKVNFFYVKDCATQINDIKAKLDDIAEIEFSLVPSNESSDEHAMEFTVGKDLKNKDVKTFNFAVYEKLNTTVIVEQMRFTIRNFS